MRHAEIVLEGLALNPESRAPPPGTRGRIKRSTALNLLILLEERYEEMMGFFEHPGVHFNNNQAKRDLRMMKIRKTISGTFRGKNMPPPSATCAPCSPRRPGKAVISSTPSSNCCGLLATSAARLRAGAFA